MADAFGDAEIEAKRRNSEKGTSDGGGCRICRGSGSKEEPLFYPCKCSGSIKYVHQACLMEWLSHSQKKHCEICKTPFRFTKLYDPHMPSSVPVRVFLKQASLHILHCLMAWSRWNLVIFVWLGWVPWCMRSIWRGLFWIGDGAWITRYEIERYVRRLERLSAAAEASASNGTSLIANVGSSTAGAIAGMWPKWNTVSQTLNYTSREPTILRLSKRIFSGFMFPYTAMIPSQNATGNITAAAGPFRSPSLLSDVKFLRKITRWQTLNNILIDILEGQLITISIVITFILVFLIREWVVQQQPIANVGAGGEGPRAPERPARGDNQIQDALPAPNAGLDEQAPATGAEGEYRHNPASTAAESAHAAEEPAAEDQVNTRPSDATLPLDESVGSGSDIERKLRRTPATDFSLARSLDPDEDISEFLLDGLSGLSDIQAHDQSSSSSFIRPGMPTKDAVAQVTDIQRTLEEESVASGKPSPSVDVFMELWNRADGNPDRALEIIHGDGQSEQLGWIVPAMQRLRKSNAKRLTKESSIDDHDESAGPMPDDEESKRSSDSWQVVDEQGNRPDFEDPQQRASKIQPSKPSDSRGSNQPRSDQTPVDGLSGDSSNSTSHRDEAPRGDRDSTGRVDEDLVDDIDIFDQEAGNGVDVPENEPPTIRAAVRDWLWGGIPAEAPAEEQGIDDERVVEDIADEAPFVPVADGQRILDNVGGEDAENENRPLDPEVVRAAAEAGIDPNDVEAIEEGEDLEGIMELIGIQGPLIGLVQNGMFSTVLISMTVLFGVWVPYVCGKLILVLLANPVVLLIKMPLRWTTTTADMVVDSVIFIFGVALYWVDRLLRVTALPVGWIFPWVQDFQQNQLIPSAAYRYTWSAAERLAKNFIATGGHFSGLDIPIFSIVAHESLNSIEDSISGLFKNAFSAIKTLAESPSPGLYLLSHLWHLSNSIARELKCLPKEVLDFGEHVIESISVLFTSNPLKINLDIPARTEPLNYELSNWNTRDRFLAIAVGYVFFSTLGALYLKLRRFFKEFYQENMQNDGVVVDVLNQAAGVLKVILIITIEMIVFPLYCGILLDIALLPLFESTTIVSRLLFTATSPATSLFVHWFVGTCYMFHFALFVSMCRRIMRRGVLYFIRDPDDPSFHPVRDVLERNVSTQLRKIMFSALVYGGLVIVCLGAVVWGLSYVLGGIFPIHWSSNEPVLEFPVDLLVYNFLMPVAIKLFKPSTGLESMYRWWFQRCARSLRLTEFLFGEKREDERGQFGWAKDSIDSELEKKDSPALLSKELLAKEQMPKMQDSGRQSHAKQDGDEQGTEEPSPEKDTSEDSGPENRDPEKEDVGGNDPDVTPFREQASKDLSDIKQGTARQRLTNHDGRLVRAPASDQVRIPKGRRTFVEVDQNNNRLDGLPDNHQGLHGKENKMFTTIYIPPYFRLRIASFIVLLWLFAATTGVSLTIVPLVFGRYVFSHLIPSQPRVNDIYAFAIGIYLLGGPLYLTMLYRDKVSSIFHRLSTVRNVQTNNITSFLSDALHNVLHFLRLVYFYGAFTLLLPSLFALVYEAYLLIPLHTYFTRNDIPPTPHTIHFISDWTLGVLYVRVGIRLVLRFQESRPSRALRALVSQQNNGASWLNPDIGLATRAFIIPLTVLLGFALLFPLGFGWLLNSTCFFSAAESSKAVVYRYSYPTVSFIILAYAFGRVLARAIGRWRAKVRDEVYLIGERLHNFGEKRARVNRIIKRE